MTKYFIAISKKGAEFLYKKNTAIAVPASSADKIAEALNTLNYKLNPGETWHKHENNSYLNDYIESEIKRYTGKNITVSKYNG